MITKQIAAILYAYGYKLVDKEGNEYRVYQLWGSSKITLMQVGYVEHTTINYNEIGTDYFILARPLSDLTKNIEGVGVPILEIGKIFGYKDLEKQDCDGEILYGWHEQSLEDGEDYTFSWSKSKNTFGVFYGCDYEYKEPIYSLLSFEAIQWLDANHFLRGVDESLIKYIE